MRAMLARHWFLLALVVGLGLTLALPDPLRPLARWIDPRLTVAAALFLMAWTMPGKALADELRRPWPAAWAVAVSYGIVPALAWLLGQVAPLPDLGVGLVLVSSVPCTLASAVLWTRLAGGNEATALLTVLGTTLASWLLTTAWLTGTTGTAVALDPVPMMLDLAACLVLPVAAGQLARRPPASARFADRHRRLLGAAAQVFVLAIVLKAGVTVGTRLLEGSARLTPGVVAAGVALAVGLHLLALFVGLGSSRVLGFDRGRQIAVAFAGSQKTLPVSLLLFEQYFTDAYPLAVLPLLFYHVGQLVLDTPIAHRLRERGEDGR
jgi:sodium/bile acid cotransporter 7